MQKSIGLSYNANNVAGMLASRDDGTYSVPTNP